MRKKSLLLSPRRLASLALCSSLLLPAMAAQAQEPMAVKKKVRTKHRYQAPPASSESRTDDLIDDRRDFGRENREDWQEHWNEDEERDERERLQQERAGTNGKACIYGRDGEVLHQPEGATCTRPPGPRPPPRAEQR